MPSKQIEPNPFLIITTDIKRHIARFKHRVIPWINWWKSAHNSLPFGDNQPLHIITIPEGKKPHKPFFAGLIIQKSYVGLYFMPLFSDPEIASRIGSELMSTFKGRTGFHIGSLTPTLRSQIESALSVGLDLYESKGWA